MKVSAEVPDWSREKRYFFVASVPGVAGQHPVLQRHAGFRNPLRIVVKKWAVLRHRSWSVVTGADIPLNCQMGALRLPHPNGIVIHPGARIGPNCLIFQRVTIGTRIGEMAPVIGDHVDIGAGAKILGNVRIGDHACIGANAVVLKDVPAGKTAVGTLAVES